LISREMMGAYIPMLHNQFKEQMNLLVGKIDLTTSQIHVLFYLKSRGDEEVIQKDIEETFNLTNPTVTGIDQTAGSEGFRHTHGQFEGCPLQEHSSDRKKHRRLRRDEAGYA